MDLAKDFLTDSHSVIRTEIPKQKEIDLAIHWVTRLVTLTLKAINLVIRKETHSDSHSDFLRVINSGFPKEIRMVIHSHLDLNSVILKGIPKVTPMPMATKKEIHSVIHSDSQMHLGLMMEIQMVIQMATQKEIRK